MNIVFIFKELRGIIAYAPDGILQDLTSCLGFIVGKKKKKKKEMMND